MNTWEHAAEMHRKRVAELKASGIPLCEACEEQPGVFRLIASDLAGTVLDTELRCRDCAGEWHPSIPE